jgi:hypothetical protein
MVIFYHFLINLIKFYSQKNKICKNILCNPPESIICVVSIGEIYGNAKNKFSMAFFNINYKK